MRPRRASLTTEALLAQEVPSARHRHARHRAGRALRQSGRSDARRGPRADAPVAARLARTQDRTRTGEDGLRRGTREDLDAHRRRAGGTGGAGGALGARSRARPGVGTGRDRDLRRLAGPRLRAPGPGVRPRHRDLRRPRALRLQAAARLRRAVGVRGGGRGVRACAGPVLGLPRRGGPSGHARCPSPRGHSRRSRARPASLRSLHDGGHVSRPRRERRRAEASRYGIASGPAVLVNGRLAPPPPPFLPPFEYFTRLIEEELQRQARAGRKGAP